MESLHFAAPVLADAPRVRELTARAMGSDAAFANTYLLQQKYGTTIAFADSFYFRHFEGNTRLCGYAFPCGEGDIAAALERIRRDAAARGRAFRFCLLTPEQKSTLCELYPGVFDLATDPGDADYIYTRDCLAELPGPAFHSKRNHITQFERLCPQWRIAPLAEPGCAADALCVAEQWLGGMPEPSPALLHETRAIAHALQHISELGLFGCVLYTAESQPIAMSIGSFISPTVADIHYEKCAPEWKKAYPLINRETARMLTAAQYINREEDLNQPGLRKAKLSYHPALLLEKSSATAVSDRRCTTPAT